MGASAEEGRDDRSTQCKKEVKKKMDMRNKALLLGTMLAALLVVGSAMMAMAYTEDPTGSLPVKTVKLSDLKIDIVEDTHDIALPVKTVKLSDLKMDIVTQDTAERGSPTTIKVDFENKTVYADGVQYELAEIHEVDVEEKGSISIEGCVGNGHPNPTLHGPFYLDQCELVDVAISHHPPNVDVLLGFVNSAGVGEGIIDYDHNGIASFQYHIPADDSYYAVVGAPGNDFCYDGHVIW